LILNIQLSSYIKNNKTHYIGTVDTTFDLGKSIATKDKEQAEYMEITGNGKVECDQKLLATNKIRINISFTIKCVKLKADEMEWGGALKDCSAERLIDELVWQGVNYQKAIQKK